MRAAAAHDGARFARVPFRNTANRMNAPGFGRNSGNATQIYFFEKYVVHIRFRLKTSSTSIIIAFVAINTRGVGFCNKLETISKAIKNKFSVRIMQKFFYPSVEF